MHKSGPPRFAQSTILVISFLLQKLLQLKETVPVVSSPSLLYDKLKKALNSW